MQDIPQDIHNNVKAILPIRPQPLGKYAREFWVFIADGSETNHAAVYKLSDAIDGFFLKRYAQLPDSHMQLSPQTSGDIFISFNKEDDKSYTPHPPLLLSPNGGMRRACETQPANHSPSKKASP